MDKMAEWLRRRTVIPLGSACVGWNSIFVVFLIGSMVKWIAIFSLNSAIRDKISEKTGILKTSATTFFENFEKEKITEERITSSVMLWMASYFTAYFSKTADDIVENNDQVILPRLETGIFWWIDTQDNDYNNKSWQEQVKNFWLC